MPGNFHIESRSKFHNLNPEMSNLSHTVNHLSFGEYVLYGSMMMLIFIFIFIFILIFILKFALIFISIFELIFILLFILGGVGRKEGRIGRKEGRKHRKGKERKVEIR